MQTPAHNSRDPRAQRVNNRRPAAGHTKDRPQDQQQHKPEGLKKERFQKQSVKMRRQGRCSARRSNWVVTP